MRNNILVLICFGLLFLGCAYVRPSKDKAQWYVVLENGGPGKFYPVSKISGTVCLKIVAKSWDPIIGPDGFGGPREDVFYWMNLTGVGPIFRDPALDERNGHPPLRHLGTITIDKKNSRVTIDLQRVISKPGEPLKTEPSPANGTYRIKRWEE
jgi:hypothetical protein